MNDDAPAAELYREFMRAPLGPYSPALRELLLEFRSTPTAGKIALFCVAPGRRWVLVRLPGRRGTIPAAIDDTDVTSIADGERRAFSIRWRERFHSVPDAHAS